MPFVIVIFMALPATKVVVAMKDTSAADLTIKATGIQWKWGYDYLKGEGEGIGFVSTLDAGQREMSDAGKPSGDDYLLKVDNPLVVPVDKKVRIITTANDVIHAFMVPAFGVKQDAIPGFVRDTWFRAEKIGDYYGQCAELCGKEHAYMPIHVKVVSQADYTRLGRRQEEGDGRARPTTRTRSGSWPTWSRAARRSTPPTAPPATRPTARAPARSSRSTARRSCWMPTRTSRSHVLLNGQNNGAMPAWKQLSDTEIAAVITYTKNSWSNKTGQLVQPAEVLAARK